MDDADLALVERYSWSVFRSPRSSYAQARVDGTNQQMHRVILGAKRGELVDHINHDGLDNRRANLRLCTHQQNSFNRRPNPGTKSGLKCVHWDPEPRNHSRPWRARATLNGKKVNIGRFKTPEEGARRVHGIRREAPRRIRLHGLTG